METNNGEELAPKGEKEKKRLKSILYYNYQCPAPCVYHFPSFLVQSFSSKLTVLNRFRILL